MFIITFIFSALFLQDVIGQLKLSKFFDCDYCWWGDEGNAVPEPEWNRTYQEKFDLLGARNFSKSVAHLLHGLTVEAAWTSFGIKLPKLNGIPTFNANLSANHSDAVLANVPSRPNGHSSPGMHGFVDYMDHITNPNWMIRGTILERILHAFHMQELWAVARKAADGFMGVSDDICTGAFDHANNGINKSITGLFKYLKYTAGQPNTTIPGVPNTPLIWDDNGESWKHWKAGLSFEHVTNGSLKSMGLYAHCLMRKFRPTEQPIGLDGCCNSKTVGEFSYTKVSTGKVPKECLNGCIYRREGDADSRYCFAVGKEKVGCLN